MAGRSWLPVSFGGHDHNIIYMGCNCCVDHIVADFLKWGGFDLPFLMPFDAWKHEFSNEGNREVSADIGRYPTITIKPQPTTINSQPTTKDRAASKTPGYPR